MITPSTRSDSNEIDHLLCTASVPQSMATFSWTNLVTNDLIGNEERLDLSKLCNGTFDYVDSWNRQETRSVQCTASVYHELFGTVTASSNISFNVSINDYCNSTLG